MELETAGQLSDHGPIHSHHASDKRDAHTLLEELKRARAEEIVQRAIDRINANPDIPESKKVELRERLLGALSSGDLSAVALVMANVASDVKTQEAKDDVADLNMILNETYPNYAEYSYEGRRVVRASLEFAHEHSATYRTLETEAATMPKEFKLEAQDQQQQNWEALNALRNDPEMMKKYGDDIAIMRRLNFANMPQGEAIIQMMKDGKDAAEVHAAVEKVVDLQSKVVGQVMGEVVPHLKQESQDYIHEHYGNPPNSRRMVDDWAKISIKDRDAIYKAMSNGDTSHLSDEQRKLMPQVQHLSAVMIAADGAQTMYAGIEMAKDKQLEAKLKDKSLSVEERGELVEKYMANHNFGTMDSAARDRFAREFIETIDKHPEALEYARKGQIDKVGALYQQEIMSDYAATVSGGVASNNYDDVAMSFVQLSRYDQAKEAVPDWVKNNKDRYTAYQQESQDWLKIEESKSHRDLEKESMVKLAEQQKSGEVTPTKTAAAAPSMRELENQSMAKMEAETTVNAPVAEAKPAFVLPPGIDLADLKSLAAAGVSSPEVASRATDKSPSNQQNTQVAEVQVGSRLG